MRTSLWCLSLLLLLAPASARADDAGVEFFEKKIRPLLVEHCFECHASTAKEPGGNLLLDSRAGLRQGGDSGPAISPGTPDESLLIKAIRYRDDALKMPPQGRLPAAAIADLEAWVKMGAPDPRLAVPPVARASTWEETLRSRREWWSMQPVRKPPVPTVQDARWLSEPVDRFLIARLEAAGLAPAAPADPRTLARRLSLVLTGLPPTPEQTESFVSTYEAEDAASPGAVPRAAVESLVDALLASPHFGERWARHWLDVVRFTETHGNEWNYEVHHAWRFRDYLIRAFNDDVPYDQFVREHIAGDLLTQPRRNAQDHFNESVIGTAFYRFGEVNHDDCIGLRQIGFDLADNQIDTLSKAFQATTIACARCHDHKLDAISANDYYALLGILRSSRLVSHSIDAPEVNAALIGRLSELTAEIRRELATAWLRDAAQVGGYLQAAQVKHVQREVPESLLTSLDAQRLERWAAVLDGQKKPAKDAPAQDVAFPLEDPLEPWRALVAATAVDESLVPSEWKKMAERYAQEDRQRTESNAQQFETFADFRNVRPTDWQVAGQGPSDPAIASGELVLSTSGDTVVSAVLPAGAYTHTISDKLNGALRSPVLPLGKQHISFQVMGQHGSALRLVSNNCQLNYKNYRSLTNAELQWVTFAPPDDRDSLRVYAELMTMFDNPKFPDQLSALGGDGTNYRLPWEQAVANPRSYFGVTRVVLHDGPQPPQPELSHLRTLFTGAEPGTLADAATRYAAAIERALRAWAENRATDDDARWINALVRRDLLTNAPAAPKLQTLLQQYRQSEAELALPRIVPGVADCGPGFDQPVLIRGDCLRPGEPVPRRYLEALSPSVESFNSAGSGRLELAERLASPDNPLTARVMVNRVWQHVFGTGLVRTVDDFGHVGELPSHPELLDYLAAQFVEEGWSVKRLIRTLVLSRAFQLASQPSSAARELDPQNRLLQHFPARRMEAEAIRDSILAASGRLDRTLYGLSVQPYREKENADRRLFPGPLDGHGRRSIYIKNTLMEAPKFLAAFNFPGGKVAQGRRDVTNVPAQALALLNDPFVVEQAALWGERLVTRDDPSVRVRVESMFLLALNRRPGEDELVRFEQAAQQFAELQQVSASDVMKSREIWQALAHAVFNLKEFIYIP